MKKINLLLFLTIGIISSAFSQKVMLIEGDLSSLKGIKELNIIYDYSNLEVGDFPSEQAYKDKRIKELNEKEAGRGDKWEESWERDKTVRYPEKFEALLIKGLSAHGIHAAQNNENATYTLIVKTKFIEPGFNVGVMKKAAAVSFEYHLVETNNQSTVLAKLSHKLVPGAQAMGYDYDAGTRIAESYAKSGKMLAAFISKHLKQ